MADERRREAERRAATGSVEDEARLLVERVRSGQLTNEQLALAAYCGHEPARVASNAAEPPADDAAWLDGLDRLDVDAIATAASALVLHCLEALDPGLSLDAARSLLSHGRVAPVGLLQSAHISTRLRGTQGTAFVEGWTLVDAMARAAAGEGEYAEAARRELVSVRWNRAIAHAFEASGRDAGHAPSGSLLVQAGREAVEAGLTLGEVTGLVRAALLARALASR